MTELRKWLISINEQVVDSRIKSSASEVYRSKLWLRVYWRSFAKRKSVSSRKKNGNIDELLCCAKGGSAFIWDVAAHTLDYTAGCHKFMHHIFDAPLLSSMHIAVNWWLFKNECAPRLFCTEDIQLKINEW